MVDASLLNGYLAPAFNKVTLPPNELAGTTILYFRTLPSDRVRCLQRWVPYSGESLVHCHKV